MYGSFLLAIYDPQSETFQTISKIGTGFSEEALQEQSAKLREFVISEPRNYYRSGAAVNGTWRLCLRSASHCSPPPTGNQVSRNIAQIRPSTALEAPLSNNRWPSPCCGRSQ